MDKKFNFQELQAIVATLRGENGCPWDKSQTHESLKLYTLEEAYEVNQAVSNLATFFSRCFYSHRLPKITVNLPSKM